MKKTLLSLFAFALVFSTNAQTIWSDDFEDSDISDWTLYNEDGDAHNWQIVQFTGYTPALVSDSWVQAGPLNPDNWAVTPAISLAGQSGQLTLSWDVAGVDPDYSAENYTVYVATANTVAALSGSSTSFSQVVTQNGPGGLANFYTKSIDVSSFAGQTIYVGFRHHNVTDQFRIAIDNARVYVGPPVSVEENSNNIVGFSHFYNMQAQTLNLAASQEFSHISVYSVIGQQVISQKLNNRNEIIDLSRLSPGVYFFNIESQGRMKTLKIAVK